MTLTVRLREQVRGRANFACEYCGVTETDTAGELTIDHYRPQSADGEDTLENLVYCCARCNQYKRDYWMQTDEDIPLWNPRLEAFSQHFLELSDGTLYPLTEVGIFTLEKLRLDRAPLVAYRLQKRQRLEEKRLLAQYGETVGALERLSTQYAELLTEHQALLKQNERLLIALLRKKE